MSETGGELLMEGMANRGKTSSSPMTATAAANKNGEPQRFAVEMERCPDQPVMDAAQGIA